MVIIENRCCDCAVPSYPCRGNSCPNRHVEVHYCDKCGAELEEHEIRGEDEDLCTSCLEETEGG